MDSFTKTWNKLTETNKIRLLTSLTVNNFVSSKKEKKELDLLSMIEKRNFNYNYSMEYKDKMSFEKLNSYSININSPSFKEKHHIVMMNQICEFKLKDFENKQVMTFGLGGCTAFIVVSNQTKNVLFGHVDAMKSSQDRMISNIRSFLYKYPDSKIIMKLPTHYVKDSSDKWIEETVNKTLYENMFSDKITIISYSTNIDTFNQYKSKLFLKFNSEKKSFQYSDNYGYYLDI